VVFSTNKTDCHDITEILFESGIKHHKPKNLLNMKVSDHKLRGVDFTKCNYIEIA
jgi:hypothetical protein